MKKMLSLFAAGLLCAVFCTGCASAYVAQYNGFPAAIPGLLITDLNSAAMVDKKILPPNYKVLGPVEAEAKTVNYIGLFAFGDATYKYLKRQALEHQPQAKDIINVEIDYRHKNILCLVNEVTTILRGIAVTY